MAVPAARYLVRFDKSEVEAVALRDEEAEIPSCSAPVALSDSLERVEDAHRRGKEEGLALARASFETELGDERRRFERDMQAAQAHWSEQVADRLAAEIPAAFQELEARIAESVARLLRPAMMTALREEVVASMSDALAKLRSGEAGRLIAIRGPAALLGGLRRRMPDLQPAIEFLPGDSAEVRVSADQTVLDSQIQAWCSRLETSAG